MTAATPSHAQQTRQQVAVALAPSRRRLRGARLSFQIGRDAARIAAALPTLGAPARDAKGRPTNAVLILHGTGGSGRGFLRPIFAGVLFGPGQLLDASRYFIILPDAIGHGKSSKPSDGLHAHFPQYDYDDMVAAQHELVEKGLGVDHLRLILGTSMGCMHSFVWGETYPDYMDALMPLACQAVAVAGRNRVWRKMVIDGIRNDPEWKNGDYTTEPRAANGDLDRPADDLPAARRWQWQKNYPTREAADKYLEDYPCGVRQDLRRQRCPVRRQRVEELRSVAWPREDQGVGHVGEFRG